MSSHLLNAFGTADVHSAGMRYEFDGQGNQTNSFQISGMGADVTAGSNLTGQVLDSTFDNTM